MKNLHLFLSLLILNCLLLVVPACGQQKQPPRLIVRADDMGFSHAANDAIMQTVKEGVATSIEVLVPSPWFPEAVKILKDNPSIDVGVHLTLTSEWDNMKFRPVSGPSSITDEGGYFYPIIHPNKNRPGQALMEHGWKLEDIEREFRAQIELALKKIPHISHITAHMGCYDMTPEVQAMTKKLAREYGIDIDPADYKAHKVRYAGPKETAEEKVQSFIKMLESLEAGETYFFVDHPGLNTPELKAIHHAGYDNVAVDRQGVTDCWTDQRVKETIRRLGIQLISYPDLVKK
ncbi:hypothetical protein D770_12535 [Flammeovirgaceae bacterium 311]|nr:hypothetical protein D770_12535 [Flammeovirgaceae bacterium 311]